MNQSQFKVVRQIRENVWPYKPLTPRQTKLIENQKQRSTQKRSDFGKRLINNKKLSLFYGKISLRKIKQHVLSTRAQKTINLMLILETRLDTLLVRAQFCTTVWTARQLIAHKKICVNHQIVTHPTYHITNGDIVSIIPKFKGQLQESMQLTLKQTKSTAPSNLEVNYKIGSFILLREPRKICFPYTIDLALI